MQENMENLSESHKDFARCMQPTASLMEIASGFGAGSSAIGKAAAT